MEDSNVNVRTVITSGECVLVLAKKRNSLGLQYESLWRSGLHKCTHWSKHTEWYLIVTHFPVCKFHLKKEIVKILDSG